MNTASQDTLLSGSSEAGIVWRSFEDTKHLLEERRRPVLAFVKDHGPRDWPFLREILRAMPGNEMLRTLLAGPCLPMLLEADALPEYMATLGAGDSYHIAVLSPAGLTTMARFDHITGDPDALVRDIAGVLERLAPVYA